MAPRGLFAVLSASLALVASPAAGAQEQEVDPDSPAGVEYQLPIDRARAEADPTRDSDAGPGRRDADGGTEPAPLFGRGIVPAAEDRPGAADGSRSGNRTERGTTGGGRKSGAKPARASAVPSASQVLAGDGDAGLWTSLLIGLAVVLSGVGIGLVARRFGWLNRDNRG